MNVGSLFAGIGGFDLGLERAGMRTVWQVELDPYRRAVLAKHFPDAERFEDVQDVGAHNLAPVDVIAGGFPCQDLSIAGLRAGIDGKRSGLWVEFARIIRELRPRYVIVENVANLLVRGLERVLGDLAACGYDAEWDCLPASAFGAPHRRDRIWIVAYPQAPGQLRAVELEDHREGQRSGRGLDIESGGEVSRAVADTERSGSQGHGNGALWARAVARGGAEQLDQGRALDDPLRGRHGPPEGQVPTGGNGTLDAGWWGSEPDVGRVAHGIPSRVDRLAALGDSLVPQIAEWIGRRIMNHEVAA